jgi:hypothetical protein
MEHDQGGAGQLMPTGWLRAGTAPDDYHMGIDREESHGGAASGYVMAKAEKSKGFGTLMQAFKADKYIGKRIRLSAYVKVEDVQVWAGLWMRVDGPTGASLAFDNMQDRPVRGTGDWQRYEIVLDVPAESVNIAFGFLLAGPGTVWADDFQFEAVGADVPVTDLRKKMKPLPDEPVNLGFES